MKKTKVLILDAQNINALAFVREIGKLNHYVGVLGQSFLSLSFLSNFSNKNHVIGKYINGKSYVHKIIQIAKKNQYEVIIPLSLKSFSLFSKYRNLIDDNVRIVLPPSESMEIASKKHKTFTYAGQNKISSPETIKIHKKNLSSLKPFIEKIGFPLVVKGSISGVDNLKYCNNLSQLIFAIRKLLENENVIICQEYIKGETHGFYAYYIDNKLHSYFMHKRIKQYPITGGPSSVARSHYDNKLKIVSEKLLDSLDWNGPVMIEYKFDKKSEEYKLIEINPKLWGSLDLTINAGVNIPIIMLHHSLGVKSKSFKNYKDIYFRWIYPNELLHDLATGFKRTNMQKGVEIKTNIFFEDFLPTIFQFSLAIFKFIIYLIKGKLRHPSGNPSKI